LKKKKERKKERKKEKEEQASASAYLSEVPLFLSSKEAFIIVYSESSFS